jgi:hypothetical protein
MAKLSARARAKIPAAKFAGPHRSFPLENPAHDRAAIRLAPRSEKAGNISHRTMEHIISAAKAKLGRR